jgi:hypothetical protein
MVKDFGSVIKKGGELVAGLLMDHKDEIKKAFYKGGEKEAFNISTSVKLSAGKNGGVEVKAGISFVESQIKASAEATVSDQMKLPDANKK